ncbi:hypothetical protein L202_03294 [Cryptococcus amylolentus CBS 6039]|uniref:Uncharacterized protein n=1 Tax=Cryptococcus amylolentus CBS 6039 TaxID=1295533 RepID=A0A1E3HUV4_9TREE|nr:hypothetical protein L202_03294 [Cryptococcus amylolentus CBS 6039]ODN79281.1 hypothetical protein L202_03294 [Cryptococcus amylolentus CBS 6039]
MRFYGKDARWYRLGSEHVLNAISKVPEDVPSTLKEALRGEEKEFWRMAIKTELSTIEGKDVRSGRKQCCRNGGRSWDTKSKLVKPTSKGRILNGRL